MKLKDSCSLEGNYDKPRQPIKKQGRHFADKGPYSQSYGFPSNRVWMWELEHKEGWVLKNWCFGTVVLEKTLESPLDSKEIKPVNPKRNQPWIFIGRTKATVLWSPDVKSWLTGKDPNAGKDWEQEEKRVTEDEMVSDLTFKSLIHFKFIFVLGVRDYSNLILLHVPVQFSQHHL